MRKSSKCGVSADNKRHRLGNLMQRCFSRPKNARSLAFQHDKTAEGSMADDD